MTETWVFNEAPSVTGSAKVWSVNFVSNGQAFTKLTRTTGSIRYQNETAIAVYMVRTATWSDENYRTVTFEEAPSGTLLEWLTVAATKVPAKRINRVDLNGVTVLDLTSDTVTPETLLVGTTAHNAKGEIITGTLVPCTVYSAESPALDGTTSNSDTTFTWDIPSTKHGFNSKNLIVSVYLSTGEQIQCDVTISDTFTVTLTAVYNSEIVTRAGGVMYVSIPAGYLRAVIIGPVETPAAVQQAMLNQLPVYTGGGNY